MKIELTYQDRLKLKEKYGYYPCPKRGCDGVMKYQVTLSPINGNI